MKSYVDIKITAAITEPVRFSLKWAQELREVLRIRNLHAFHMRH